MSYFGPAKWIFKEIETCIERFRQLRSTRVVLRIAVAGIVLVIGSGVGHLLFKPARNDPSEAAETVSALIDGRATLATVPSAFGEELGYEPVPVAGSLVNPHGQCSTPGGVGPASFEEACRVHDFGYDVLRYADRQGTPLGPWARFEIDLRFYDDLLRTCETASCRATATAFYTAVTVNSIRQGYVAPTVEPTLPWAGAFLGVVAIGTTTANRGSLRSYGLLGSLLRCLLGLTFSDTCLEPDYGERPGSTKPVSKASRVTSCRLATPSLSKMCFMWFSRVLTLMLNSMATSRYL